MELLGAHWCLDDMGHRGLYRVLGKGFSNKRRTPPRTPGKTRATRERMGLPRLRLASFPYSGLFMYLQRSEYRAVRFCDGPPTFRNLDVTREEI
jgi:hypothetical protein